MLLPPNYRTCCSIYSRVTMRGIIYATLLTLISGRSSNSSTLSATSISSHHSSLQPSSAALQSTSIDMAMPYRYSFHVKPDTAIANSLEEYKLDRWGFVIYRCTYGSQEKWDKFLALAKQEARDYLERWGTGDLSVYDKIDWTVIEDAETLDGASILNTTRKFRAWVEADGRAEMQGSVFTDTWQYAPRYHYFMHVDEESLESVVDDEKARDRAAGYFCKIIYPSSVMGREEARVAGEIPDDQDPLDEQLELLDCIKKVKLGSLVELYVTLLNLDSWYNIYVDVDYDHVGIADV
ncbi:hypothetical protein QBC46DRAFT_388211 [Diplogelasinospora grovesii]|uniref:Uncharacterized protein n=1 Tax=Diplogelasinospora grovesii TaxID=303347 RepID=A0AAN6N6B1_9PEZI|nr:hypothetical protein QBC46DRAFT_388211 [Diplogelasinospora grovesii]